MGGRWVDVGRLVYPSPCREVIAMKMRRHRNRWTFTFRIAWSTGHRNPRLGGLRQSGSGKEKAGAAGDGTVGAALRRANSDRHI